MQGMESEHMHRRELSSPRSENATRCVPASAARVARPRCVGPPFLLRDAAAHGCINLGSLTVSTANGGAMCERFMSTTYNCHSTCAGLMVLVVGSGSSNLTRAGSPFGAMSLRPRFGFQAYAPSVTCRAGFFVQHAVNDDFASKVAASRCRCVWRPNRSDARFSSAGRVSKICLWSRGCCG